MQDLAEFLKTERLRLGLTLKEVSKRTSLSISMLESLEEGDFARIGTPLLIRAFIRGFCRALGIDPEPLIIQHGEEIRAYDRQNEGIKRYGVWSKPLRRRRRLGLPGRLLLLLFVVVSFYGGVWMVEKQTVPRMPDHFYSQQEYPSDLRKDIPPAPAASSSTGSEPVTARNEKSSTEGKVEKKMDSPPVQQNGQEDQPSRTFGTTNSPTEVLADDRPLESSLKNQSHRFRVEADQKTWIEVRVDDRKPVSAMLQPGESREWEAERDMQVIVGNAGGVRMKWDEQAVSLPGKPGRVLKFRLPDAAQQKEQQKPT